MQANLLQLVEKTSLDFDEISTRTRRIHEDLLSQSKYLDTANFSTIHPSDLELLFAGYDKEFFCGQLRTTLGTTPLRFRFSKRMTSAGGKTTWFTDQASGKRRYEITVSLTILALCFEGEDPRPIATSGILCHDRLDALQRILEHELVHLIEVLLWGESSCSRSRFHSISLRCFGHTENRHQLVTPKERAVVKYGIQPGMTVRFIFDGTEHSGVVNRINKRATVLVEDANGVPYSDGKHYAKFYVPIRLLERVS